MEHHRSILGTAERLGTMKETSGNTEHHWEQSGNGREAGNDEGVARERGSSSGACREHTEAAWERPRVEGTL